MRIWLISFLTLLALARGLEWLHHLTLPFPILLLGGNAVDSIQRVDPSRLTLDAKITLFQNFPNRTCSL